MEIECELCHARERYSCMARSQVTLLRMIILLVRLRSCARHEWRGAHRHKDKQGEEDQVQNSAPGQRWPDKYRLVQQMSQWNISQAR